MRRLLVIVLFLLLLVMPVLGQDSTPAPVDEQAAAQATTMAEMHAIATVIAESGTAAEVEFDRAMNILGIFEGVGLIVSILSIVGTVLAVAAGVVGFRGLADARSELEATRQEVRTELEQARNRVQTELTDAHQRFDSEMEMRQQELGVVRQEVEQTVKEQREAAASANLAMSFLSLGERQYKSQDFSGALETYRYAISLDPNNLITHYRLGYVYTQSGDLKEAEEHLQSALKIEPKFAPALAGLGYVYRRIGEKMPIDPDAPNVERDKVLNRAESLLLEALSLSPKLTDDDGESWWGSLGGLYRRRGQVEEAIKAYESAAKLTPKSSYAYSNLALLYVQKGDTERMYPTYVRVEQLAAGEVQEDVDNYWAYADLLTARLALGKVKEAEETLVSVLEVAPKEGPYVFESLLDTLRRLAKAMGEDKSQHVRNTIQVIEATHEAQTVARAAGSSSED